MIHRGSWVRRLQHNTQQRRSRNATLAVGCFVARSNGYRTADDPCYIETFDESSLIYLRSRTGLRLVIGTRDSASDDRLADWSQSFYAVSVWRDVLAPHWTVDRGYKNWIGNNTTDFVARAHRHGLKASDILFMHCEPKHVVVQNL